MWARGGGHRCRNLAALCSTHHRAVHAGCLGVERLVSGAIRVTHGDGRVLVGAAWATHVGELPSCLFATPPPWSDVADEVRFDGADAHEFTATRVDEKYVS